MIYKHKLFNFFIDINGDYVRILIRHGTVCNYPYDKRLLNMKAYDPAQEEYEQFLLKQL